MNCFRIEFFVLLGPVSYMYFMFCVFHLCYNISANFAKLLNPHFKRDFSEYVLNKTFILIFVYIFSDESEAFICLKADVCLVAAVSRII